MAQVIWNSDIDVYNPLVIPVLVARNVSKYLSVQDLLSFMLMSKNAYKSANDPILWVNKLKQMGLWDSALPLSPEHNLKAVDFLLLDSPLTCLDRIIKSTKLAKFQVLKIYKCLHVYYNDLSLNKSYEKLKLFKDFQTPEEQAKILSALLKLNEIDYSDSTSAATRDKIISLFEIFENALLRELEIHYDIQDYATTRRFIEILVDLNNDVTLMDFFLQKSIFDNEDNEFFNIANFNPDDFFLKNSPENDEDSDNEIYTIKEELLDKFIEDLADIFNKEADIIDKIFPQKISMMYKVCEELISNQVMELFMSLIETSKRNKVYLSFVPILYVKLTNDFISKLNPCENMGESYLKLVRQILDMLFESFVAEYMREELLVFKSNSNKSILEWKESISKREEETSKMILKHVKVDAKNDFLTSFKKVFISSSKEKGNEDVELYSETQAKAKILSENLKSLNKTLNPELVLEVLNEAKSSLHRLLNFSEFSIAAIHSDILSTVQEIFTILIDIIGNEHLKPGFNKALIYLKTYNIDDLDINLQEESLIEPLVMFFELINMADVIIQMIEIFYKEEMISRNVVKHENSILNPSLQAKKKLEALVDTYVADGLNVGIGLLAKEIEKTFVEFPTSGDYNPEPNSVIGIGPTNAAQKVIKLLDNNIDSLVNSADKSIIEVFQQEIAERFFQIIVRNLKKSVISESGALSLISDLNLYHDFMLAHIKSNKKLVIPLYESLKKVGNIYLISGSDSKALGKLVSDLSKFNGIFTQEEIYEFVQRRKDWHVIKRDVEKVIYGFGLADCSII